MTTTNEPQPASSGTHPVGGWGWVLRNLGVIPKQRTEHERGWDGLYRAHCPCGRDVDWDAYNHRPICSCPQLPGWTAVTE